MTSPNVLMIGNSHTAAARIALRDEPARWPGLEVRVFAMPGSSITDIALEGRHLLPANDDARSKMVYWNNTAKLSLDGYDAFVVMGCLSFAHLAGMQHSHRSPDFPSFAAGAPCIPVSTGLIDAMLSVKIARSPAMRLIQALTKLQQGPVLFFDNVLPSADCRADPQNFGPHVAMAARGDGAAFHARYLKALAEALDSHAQHLRQPGHTLRDGVFTAPEWMRGSMRMQPRRDVPHEATEYAHANAAYGALQLDQIAGALARS